MSTSLRRQRHISKALEDIKHRSAASRIVNPTVMKKVCAVTGSVVVVAGIVVLLSLAQVGEATQESFYQHDKSITDVASKDDLVALVSNSPVKIWFFEFYAHWCGHCQRFAEHYRRLEASFRPYDEYIKFAALDCAAMGNYGTCIDFKAFPVPGLMILTADPNIKLDKSETIEGVDGITLMRYDEYMDDMKMAEYVEELTVYLQKLLTEKVGVDFSKGISSTGADLDGDGDADIDNEGNLDPSSYRGTPTSEQKEVDVFDVFKALHYALTREIPTSLSAGGDSDSHEDSVMALTNILRVWENTIPGRHNRQQMYQLRTWLEVKSGVSVGSPTHTLSHTTTTGGTAGTHDNTDVDAGVAVAVSHAAWQERVREEAMKIEFYDSKEQRVMSLFDLQTKEWRGCHGSSSHLRGYPCGLWQLFHSTVLAAQYDPYSTINAKDALFAVRDYVKYFFACGDCANNFLAMASTVESDVQAADDAVLWLWKAHNQVNQRLKYDITADPLSPKIQFPAAEQCTYCRFGSSTATDIDWNHHAIISFLKEYYLVASGEVEPLGALSLDRANPADAAVGPAGPVQPTSEAAAAARERAVTAEMMDAGDTVAASADLGVNEDSVSVGGNGHTSSAVTGLGGGQRSSGGDGDGAGTTVADENMQLYGPLIAAAGMVALVAVAAWRHNRHPSPVCNDRSATRTRAVAEAVHATSTSSAPVSHTRNAGNAGGDLEAGTGTGDGVVIQV
eukprot:GFYU01001980.1.p1 GENE.GFYU01001980.1~~GFYU01001980.1.p1  ORF type:complete len:732 (+),score=192.17 GFYU01001980.1:188-2383(+)